jgi:hypothetical protein
MFHPLQYAGPTRIPPPKMQLRVRRETGVTDTINARQFEHWQTDVPVTQGGLVEDPKIAGGPQPSYYDMAPLSSRVDKRDYRQMPSYDPKGATLAENPYFDRYDPTRDPRNMIREMRAVVYEDKQGDRGLEESKQMVARSYMNRWLPRDSEFTKETEASLQAYSVMRPKIDDPGALYRGQAPPTFSVPNAASGPASSRSGP